MDRDEFAGRVKAVEDRLYRIACGQLRDHSDREDAVQEAVLKAWKGRERLRKSEYFETWLIRILINECRNIQRMRKRMVPADSLQETEGEPVMPEEDRELREAIRALDDRLRTPVVLYYIEGYDTRETARILRLPHGTVCGRLKRAREALRKYLSGEEV